MGALKRSATEKRQGTKSRWSVWWRCREHYGDLVAVAGLVSLDCSVGAIVVPVSRAIGGLRSRCAVTFAV
jgi:hypothetical protein